MPAGPPLQKEPTPEDPTPEDPQETNKRPNPRRPNPEDQIRRGEGREGSTCSTKMLGRAVLQDVLRGGFDHLFEEGVDFDEEAEERVAELVGPVCGRQKVKQVHHLRGGR